MALEQQAVTASTLVRNFGAWQDRALQAPVYIVHRGRPKLALTSIELLETLARPHAADHAVDTEREMLLDAFDTAAILLDREHRVLHLNRRARVFLGTGTARARSAPVVELLPPAFQPLVAAALARAADDAPETLELAAARGGEADLRLTLAPLPAGRLLVVEDLSAARQRDAARAALDALDGALALHPGIARTRVNLRGFVARPTPSLQRLTGLAPDALTRVRFAGLFDVRSRVAVSDAVEAAIEHRDPRCVAADLLVGGTRALPVAVSLAPVVDRLTIAGLLAVLVAAPTA